MVTNITFPFANQDLLLTFDIPQTATSIRSYLEFNEQKPDTLGADASVSSPIVYTLVPESTSDDGSVIPAIAITIPYFEGEVTELKVSVPVGITLTSVGWVEPAQTVYPVKWVTDKKTGERFFPITHWDAVIDKEGNKLSSVITALQEKTDDATIYTETMANKLLKEMISYGIVFTGDTEVIDPLLSAYKSSSIILFFAGDRITVPAAQRTDPSTGELVDVLYSLVDESGRVITGQSKSIDYTTVNDANFYVYTNIPVARAEAINYTAYTLAVRSGGSSGSSSLSVTDSTEAVTFADLATTKTYTVAKTSALENVKDIAQGMAVYLQKKATPTTGSAASYDILQGATAGTATSLGTIEIPVDKYINGTPVLKVATAADAPLVDGNTYLQITLSDGSVLNADVSLLNKGADADEVTITVGADGKLSVKNAGIDTSQLKDASVEESKIASLSVSTQKIANDAVTTAKIADANVTTAKIADNAVTTAKIADSNVTTSKIADSAVTTAKIADASVTNDKLATDAVGTSNIQAEAVTAAKLAADSVISTKIKDGAVVGSKIADSAVTTDKVADAAITSAKLATDSVSTVKIVNGAVTTDKLAATSVTAAKLAADAVETDKIKDGAVTLDKLDSDVKEAVENAGKADGTTIVKNADSTLSVKDAGITSSKLADDAVDTAKIKDGAITEDKLDADLKDAIDNAGKADGTTIIKNTDSTLSIKDAGVTTAKIADNAVTTAKIADDAVTADKIADSSVETSAIKDANVTKAKLANDAKIGSLVVTGSGAGVVLEIKDAAGNEMASSAIANATSTVAGLVVVDDALSTTSTNPVQNKVVEDEIAKQKVVLEVLATPTTGSIATYELKQGKTGAETSLGKIERPKANNTTYGEVQLDDQVTETTKADGSKEVTSQNAVSAKAMAEYVMNKLGDLIGAMMYMGVVNSTNALPTTYKAGATYVASEEGTYAGYSLRIGDMLIANGDSDKGGAWTAVKPTPKVENKDVTLASGIKATIATVDGKDITLTPQIIDNALSATSSNAIMNKTVSAAISGMALTDAAVEGQFVDKVDEANGIITVTRKAFDDALSTTSTNAVQNKVVNEAITAVNNTIKGLDYKGAGSAQQVITSIKQTDGKISATAANAVTSLVAEEGDYNTYQIGSCSTYVRDAKVKLTKETTPTTGSYATYSMKQGDEVDDVKVEIPDFADALTNNATVYSDAKVAAIIDVTGLTNDTTLV